MNAEKWANQAVRMNEKRQFLHAIFLKKEKLMEQMDFFFGK